MRLQDELDILREVGSIISGHGGIALSKILGRKISISVPSTNILSLQEIFNNLDPQQIGVAVLSSLITGLKGKIFFLLQEKNAFKLIDISCTITQEDKRPGALTDTGLSLIKEVGNIVMGASTSALSVILKKSILTLPPTLVSGPLEDIIGIAISDSKEDNMVLIQAEFREPESQIKGGFYIVLTSEAVADIQRICKEHLDNLGKEGRD